ncbi:MAG: hypothetical protein WD468_02300 [Pirellulales bacterium]
MRFSMKSMLAAFTFVAISCGGMLYANSFLATCFATAAFLIVMFGILAAILRAGRVRAFWTGFAVFGAGYFLLAMFGERLIDPGSQSAIIVVEPNNIVTAAPLLVTTGFLIWVEEFIALLVSSGNEPRPYDHLVFFLTNGHAIFTVLFALLGGALGSWIAGRQAVGKNQ